MTRFERAALAYFETIPRGYLQRIDGVRCYSPLTPFWFLRWRLDRMARKGLLVRRATGSFWPSQDGMPAYGLPKRVVCPKSTKDADHD